MSTQSEDNLLDQSLRDVFRDYDLPPDAHPRVWEGVAERIAVLPAPSTGLSYRLLLLPLTAAVGVGLGWLLPHPATPPAKAAAPVVHVASFTPTVAAPAMSPVASAAVEVRPAFQPVAQPQQAPRKRRVVARVRSTEAAQLAALVSLDSASTAAVEMAVTPEVVVQADSAPVVAAAPAPLAPAHTATPQASTPTTHLAPSASTKELKPAGTNEKIGYRKLTQRQPEGRRGIGRWFTRFFQGVRHLVN